jgi:hypothetical protein
LYGPFATAFERDGLSLRGHLELLTLGSVADTQLVIERIAIALREPDSQRWVAALLHERNWHPHLVAAIAMLLEPSLDHAPLWRAVDGGTWVTPQLVVTAAFVDPTFQDQARVRFAALTPSDPPRRSAKMVASVLAVAADVPDLAAWRTEQLESEHVKELLAIDAATHASPRIVASWSIAVRAAFRSRGQPLAIRSP